MTKGNQLRPFPFDYGELERLLDYYLEIFRSFARDIGSAADECLPRMQVPLSGSTKPAPTTTTRLACVSYERSFGSKERPYRLSGSFLVQTRCFLLPTPESTEFVLCCRHRSRMDGVCAGYVCLSVCPMYMEKLLAQRHPSFNMAFLPTMQGLEATSTTN